MKQKCGIALTVHTDAEDPRAAARKLAAEIKQHGGPSVETEASSLTGGTTPRGDTVSFMTIMTALASAGAFTAVIEGLKSWILRKEGRQVRIKVQVGESVTEIDYSPDSVSREELERFTESIRKEMVTREETVEEQR